MKRGRINRFRLLLVIFLLALSSAAAATLQPLLELGREAAGRIERDQSHGYPFRLAHGEFARIVVTRLSGDLEYRITNPSGEVLVRNQQTFFNGEYDSFVIAGQDSKPGEYLLSFHFNTRPGAYRVKLQEVRPATPRDKLRVDAQAIRQANDIPDHQAADAPLRRALAMLRSVPEERGALITMLEILQNSRNGGRERHERALCEEAIELARKLGDRWAEAEARAVYGVILSDLNDKGRALEELEKTIALSTELNDAEGLCRSLNLTGYLYSLLGQNERALARFSRSAPLARDLGIDAYVAGALSGAGSTLIFMGRPAEAASSLEEARIIYQKLGRASYEATVLLDLATVAEKANQPDRQKDLIGQAIALARQANDGVRIGNALHALARFHRLNNDWAKSVPLLEEAAKLARQTEVGLYLSDALSGLARAHFELGNNPRALSYIRESLQIVEGAVARSGGGEAQAEYFTNFRNQYSLLAAILRKAGSDAEAFEVSERSRARGLAAMLSAAKVDLHSGVSPALLRESTAIEAAAAVKLKELSALERRDHKPADAVTLRREIDGLRHQQDRVLARIRTAHPNYASLTQFTGIPAGRVQNDLLDDDTVLIEYMLERNRNFVWALTRDGVISAPIASAEQVERVARMAYESITARNQSPEGETLEQRRERLTRAGAAWETAAAELSKLLLEPVAPALAGRKRWLVVADEILHHVPFAALPSPVAPAAREVVNLPSAAVLAMIRQTAAGRKPAPGTVAIFADPVFEKDDARLPHAATRAGVENHGKLVLPRLPFTRREAGAILALVPAHRARLATGFAANRAAAQDPSLASYRILHFATHGILNEESPELSGIALAMFDPAGRPLNGFLRLHDLYNLKLPVDLVVLSACQSALGKRLSGEGIIGLARGMMFAGASRVVASLWKVDDAATAEFMAIFYRSMIKDGQPPAAALAAAQRQLAAQRRWSSPYYWAAFQIHGEYR